jgi:hypothetical protein
MPDFADYQNPVLINLLALKRVQRRGGGEGYVRRCPGQ